MRLHGLKDCILKSPQIKNEVKEPKPVCCWLPLVLLKLKHLHQIARGVKCAKPNTRC